MSDAEQAEAGDLLAAGVNVPALLELTLRHKVLQLVGTHLLRLDTEGRLSFPERFLMKMYREAIKQRNVALLAEAENVLRGLRERGLTAVPLKGLVLAPDVYRDLGLRAMNDVDLLIPLDERRAASDALIEMGYVVGDFDLATGQIARASAETEMSWRMHVGNLHPHALLLDDPFGMCSRIDLSYDVDTEKNYLVSKALLAGANDGAYRGVPTRVLTTIDFGIHVAVHMFKEATNDFWIQAAQGADLHLIKVCDLREYLLAYHAEIDWEQFCRRVVELGVVRAVSHGLELIRKTYGDVFVDDVLSSLRGGVA